MYMRSAKKLLRVVLSLAMVFSLLAGCTESDEADDDKSPALQGETTEVVAPTNSTEATETTATTESVETTVATQPAEPFTIEYPLTASVFCEALQRELPDFDISLKYGDLDAGKYRHICWVMDDSGLPMMMIELDCRRDETIWCMNGRSVDWSERIADVISASLSICDPDLNVEILSTGQVISNLGESDTNCTYTVRGTSFNVVFPRKPVQPQDENFFVLTGLVDNVGPMVVDGRFTRPGFALFEHLPIYGMGSPLDVRYDLEFNDDGTASKCNYGFNLFDTDFPSAFTQLDIELILLPELQNTETYQVIYNTDLDKVLLGPITASEVDLEIETILQVPALISMYCDDGMTDLEAMKLLTNTYEPYVAENGTRYTVYAPRDVAHILSEDPETGKVVYTAITKQDYEENPILTAEGEILYTEVE